MMKKILIFVIILIMIIPNLVGCKRVVNCYTLQDAYEKGLITKEELISMAYYWNNGTKYNEAIMGDNYTPIPKKPKELSDKTIDIIKEYIAEEITKIMVESLKENKPTMSDEEIKIEPYSKDYVQIMDYFGTYNNLICIRCTDIYLINDWPDFVSPGFSITIGDVEFFRIAEGNFITCYEIK